MVGNLVEPRTFVMDVGVTKNLSAVEKRGGEFDMDEVLCIAAKSGGREPVATPAKDSWVSRETHRKPNVQALLG